jgi:hypothetical protein
VTLSYFVIGVLVIKEALYYDSYRASTIFRDVPVGRAVKFGAFLLAGVPFQLFFILAVFKRYYIGSF